MFSSWFIRLGKIPFSGAQCKWINTLLHCCIAETSLWEISWWWIYPKFSHVVGVERVWMLNLAKWWRNDKTRGVPWNWKLLKQMLERSVKCYLNKFVKTLWIFWWIVFIPLEAGKYCGWRPWAAWLVGGLKARKAGKAWRLVPGYRPRPHETQLPSSVVARGGWPVVLLPMCEYPSPFNCFTSILLCFSCHVSHPQPQSWTESGLKLIVWSGEHWIKRTAEL